MAALPPTCQELPQDIRTKLEEFVGQIYSPGYWMDKEGERKIASAALKNYLKRLQYFGVYESDEVQWVDDLEAAKVAHQASIKSEVLDESRNLALQSIQSTASTHGRSAALLDIRNAVRTKLLQEEKWFFTSQDCANAADDASLAAAWLVVSDVQLEPSPFEPLLTIWENGFWPIGPLAGKFVIFTPQEETRATRRQRAGITNQTAAPEAAAPVAQAQPVTAAPAAPKGQAIPQPDQASISVELPYNASEQPVPSGDGWSIQLDWESQSELAAKPSASQQSIQIGGGKAKAPSQTMEIQAASGPHVTVRTAGLPAEAALEPIPEPTQATPQNVAPQVTPQQTAQQAPQAQMAPQVAPQHQPQQGYTQQAPQQQPYPSQPQQAPAQPMASQQAPAPVAQQQAAPQGYQQAPQQGHMPPQQAYPSQPQMQGYPPQQGYASQPPQQQIAPQPTPPQQGYPQQAQPIQQAPASASPAADPFDHMDEGVSVKPAKKSRTGLYVVLLLLLLGSGGGGYYFYINSPGVLFEQAKQLLNQKKFKKADALLRRIIKAAPNHPGSKRALGIALVEQGLTDAAIKTFKTAVLEQESDGTSQLYLGVLLREKGQLAEAQTALLAASKVLPKDGYVWLNLGMVQYQLKQPAAARNSFQKATQLAPSLHQAWFELGSTYLKEAQAIAKQAPPPDRKCQHKAPDTRQMSLAKQAETALRQASIYDRTSALYKQYLGNALMLQHQFAQAEQTYLAGLTSDAKHGGLLNDLGYTYLFQCKFEDAGKYILQSLPILRDAHTAKPNDSTKAQLAAALYNMGVALEGTKGKQDQAVIAYRQYVSLMPTDPDGFCRLGQALKRARKRNDAITAYTRCYQLNPPDKKKIKRLLRRMGKRVP